VPHGIKSKEYYYIFAFFGTSYAPNSFIIKATPLPAAQRKNSEKEVFIASLEVFFSWGGGGGLTIPLTNLFTFFDTLRARTT
jgi:hypothetical protein